MVYNGLGKKKTMFRMIRMYRLADPGELPEALDAVKRAADDTATIMNYETGFDPDREGDYDLCVIMDFATMIDAREFVHTKQYLGMMNEMPLNEETVMIYYRKGED